MKFFILWMGGCAFTVSLAGLGKRSTIAQLLEIIFWPFLLGATVRELIRNGTLYNKGKLPTENKEAME